MKIKCISNKGSYLRQYEYLKIKDKDIFGRFNASAHTEFNLLEIGKEYLVMGIIIKKNYQAFLIESDGFIEDYPTYLFEVIDNKLSNNWYFRQLTKGDEMYPQVQAIFGYYELCNDPSMLIKLTVEQDKEAVKIFYKRMKEII